MLAPCDTIYGIGFVPGLVPFVIGLFGLIVGFEDEIKVKHCHLLSVQEINIYSKLKYEGWIK
jgi:hypothetical protein